MSFSTQMYSLTKQVAATSPLIQPSATTLSTYSTVGRTAPARMESQLTIAATQQVAPQPTLGVRSDGTVGSVGPATTISPTTQAAPTDPAPPVTQAGVAVAQARAQDVVGTSAPRVVSMPPGSAAPATLPTETVTLAPTVAAPIQQAAPQQQVPWVMIGVGVLAAAALGVAAYNLTR